MKIPQLIIELGKAKEALGDIEVMMRVYDESGCDDVEELSLGMFSKKLELEWSDKFEGFREAKG